jgi:hypothetical protein
MAIPADNFDCERKILRRRRGADEELGDYCPVVRKEPLDSFAALFGINDIKAGSEDRDCFFFCRDGATMRRSINARATSLKITRPRLARSQERRSAIPVP